MIEAGASVHLKDENNKLPHEVAKNRRTMICFPRVQDPVQIQAGEVGAMEKDFSEYGEL